MVAHDWPSDQLHVVFFEGGCNVGKTFQNDAASAESASFFRFGAFISVTWYLAPDVCDDLQYSIISRQAGVDK